MKYLALIYANENAEQQQTPEQQQGVIHEYIAFEGWLATEQQGKKLGGDALMPTATGKTIRIRDGKRDVVDGPFAETREQLGGFYLFDAANLDEALELASKIPTAKVGSVEVRPVMVFDGQ